MAPNRNKRDPANHSDIDPEGVPKHPQAQGHMLRNGDFQCTRERRNGEICYSQMKNTTKCIGSHQSKHHSGPQSSYQKDQRAIMRPDREIQRVHCPLAPCGSSLRNTHSLVSHLRNTHKWKGKSGDITNRAKNIAQAEASKVVHQSISIPSGFVRRGEGKSLTSSTAEEEDGEQMQDDEDDDEDDGGLFVPFHPPDRKDDDLGPGGASGSGQGPPGTGGAQIVAV
ncbi:hypothetical protein F4809DRAFT_644742 [Biscogniauxia mediterranea]|nr:hypothetical protein F4809DRAFT_644742 [Biscogniauxia mediterranea]